MSVKKLKYKNFIANLGITKKYVGFSIFDCNKKLFNCSKIDRREVNDEEMIEQIYDLMKAMFCIYETNKRFLRTVNGVYCNSYIFFHEIIYTKNFTISYNNRNFYNFYFQKKKMRKMSDLFVNVKELVDNNKRKSIYATYDIKFSLDKPMNKEMLIEKTKKYFIRSFGM